MKPFWLTNDTRVQCEDGIVSIWETDNQYPTELTEGQLKYLLEMIQSERKEKS